MKKLLSEAQDQVALLERQALDPTGGKTREEAAQERAARERKEKLEEALKAVEKVQRVQAKNRVAHEDRRDPSEARASTTDADARSMRMPDGGTRPPDNASS